MNSIIIRPEAVPAIPVNAEGWQAWTVADVVNFVSVILWDQQNADRRNPAVAAGLDRAIYALQNYPWPLDSDARGYKLGVVEYAARLLPPGATYTAETLGELFASLGYQPPTALDVAEDATRRTVSTVNEAAKAATTSGVGLGLVGIGVGLGWLLWGSRK